MNQRERMLSGLPYKAWLDGLEEDRQMCIRDRYFHGSMKKMQDRG